jgi:hypothetical protein
VVFVVALVINILGTISWNVHTIYIFRRVYVDF